MAAIALDRVPTFTVTVSLIEDDDWSDSAMSDTAHRYQGTMIVCTRQSMYNKIYIRMSRFEFILL